MSEIFLPRTSSDGPDPGISCTLEVKCTLKIRVYSVDEKCSPVGLAVTYPV